MKKMGVRGSPTGELFFENCEVPPENLLGEENRGINVLMSGLDRERILWSIAPIGVAQGAFDLAFSYARERVQFGQPIIQFPDDSGYPGRHGHGNPGRQGPVLLGGHPGRQRKEGEAGGLLCQVVLRRGGGPGGGQGHAGFRGYGFIREYPIERMYRDVKGIEFGAGTNQIQKLIIMGELMKK